MQKQLGRLSFSVSKGPYTVLLLVLACLPVWSPTWSMAFDAAVLEPSELHGEPQRWTVLDSRPHKDFRSSHIPGALHLSWEDHLQPEPKGSSYRFPTPERLAFALGQMGIDETSPVVVYGDADSSWGGEGWVVWSLSWLGHKGPLRLLSGGIQAWTARGYPLESGTVRVPVTPTTYSITLRTELNIQAAQIVETGRSWTIIDTRSKFEWLTGHLPDAVHIPWSEFYEGRERRPLGRDALRRLLSEHGVDLNKPVVFYCTAGVRSSYAWIVSALAGLPAARNYAGGISDWKEYSARKASRRGV